jgi:hypothetical protein
MRKPTSHPRMWQCWRDPIFVFSAAFTLFAVFGSSLYQPIYAARVDALGSPIVTTHNLTEFIKMWFVLHMFEATWVSYDSFYWGVPARVAWGVVIYMLGGPVLLAYKFSRTRQRRKQLALNAVELSAA